MSDLQENAGMNSSSAQHKSLEQHLIDRDNAYRKNMNMNPLDGLLPEQHMEAIVLEHAELDTEIASGILCVRCGRNSVISYQKQVRAGDEGTNTFFRCTSKSCGNSYIGK
jgi:DNA-directed RNA polymerase subunit M/transcription elongation factor TFIIS